MWQSLCESIAEKKPDFTVLAIALDQPEAARPWIGAAATSYPCLIDRDHRTAELYHFTNVPQAVWIDERGRIVRPPETAGSTDGFRAMNRATSEMPAEALAERKRAKELYIDAVADWAVNGAQSRHVLGAADASARLLAPDADVAAAHAHFRLAQTLRRDGNEDEARAQFAEASRLHPDSWAIWREGAAKSANGLAVGAEFWARVDALGDKPYHRPMQIGDESRHASRDASTCAGGCNA